MWFVVVFPMCPLCFGRKLIWRSVGISWRLIRQECLIYFIANTESKMSMKGVHLKLLHHDCSEAWESQLALEGWGGGSGEIFNDFAMVEINLWHARLKGHWLIDGRLREQCCQPKRNCQSQEFMSFFNIFSAHYFDFYSKTVYIRDKLIYFPSGL